MKKHVLILLLLLNSIITNATTYYVSSSGSDLNNGTSTATPLKTIDKINSLVLVAGDQVLFKRGDSFSGTLSLSESGLSGNLITFGAYGTGNNPEITGFVTVTTWTNLGSNIWESTNTVSNLSTCNVVNIGGVNTPMGRTPNEGSYYKFQSHSGSTSITSSNLTGTPDWTGAEVVLRTRHFVWDRRVITSQSTSTINWSTATSYEPQNDFGFFIQNDARTLDIHNEWYYNSTTKKIIVYSTSQPTSFKLSTVENLCNISASYIKIENISFTGANSYAIWGDVHGTVRSNVTIQNCNFNFIGITAIEGLKCNTYLIDKNSISDCNTMSINIGYSTGITISNNSIDNTALFEGMANSMWSAIHSVSVTDLTIEYNRITNSGFIGIGYGTGTNNIIRYNYIDTFCKNLDDGGGIYGGVNSTVSNNVVINGIGSPESTTPAFPSLAPGIYHDQGSYNVTVSNNSVANCSEYGILCNGNTGMVVSNNTVYNASKYQIAINAWNTVDYNINDNKFICKDASQLVMWITSGTNDIPLKYTGNNNYFAKPIDSNGEFFFVSQPSTGGDGTFTLAQWKTFSSQDANSLGSPKTVSSDDDIYFYYNDTKTEKVIEIEQPSIDMASVAYYTPITLQPFTSVVLIRDATLGNYYYVSTSGNDSNDGLSPSTPWKTLSKINNTSLADGTIVNLNRGDTWNESLNFNYTTHGWDREIIVRPYGSGNKPIISGFETPVAWVSQGNGIYSTTVTNSSANMVTVNGVAYPKGRYPKSGYLTFESFSGSSSITDSQLTGTPNYTGSQVVIRMNGFQYSIGSITGQTGGTLSYTGGSGTPDSSGGYLYYIQGGNNTLTQLGDWYINGTTLYMYFGSNSPSSYSVKVASIAKLITTTKNYLTIDGLQIEGAVEKGYESAGTHNTVINCDFKSMGRYGLTCSQTTPTIDSNTFDNCFGTGIFMNANSYVISNNTINNNGLYPGMVEPGTNNYMAINIIAGSGGTCEYNTISNVGYIGISTWGSDNIIRYNKVDGFCSILPDGGGIYTNYIGSAPYPTGIKVYNNLVFNGGGEGLYSDAVNQNTEWYNNMVMNCVSGILLNTPVNHNVHDNIFYNCTYGMNFYNWHTNSLTPTGCTVANNTIVEGSASTYAVKIGDSTNRDILSMGAVNGNKFYSETGKQSAQFKAYFSPSASLTNYNLADWRTLTGFETTSTLGTLASFNKLSVIYNDTKINKNFQVVAKKDLSGKYINGTITLTPYSSKVLNSSINISIMNHKLYAY